jgi:hypothetical protein
MPHQTAEMTENLDNRRGEAEPHLNCGHKEEATTATVATRWTHYDHTAGRPAVVKAKGLQPRGEVQEAAASMQPDHPSF